MDRVFKLIRDTDYASQSSFKHRPVYPYRLQLYAESKFENKFIVVDTNGKNDGKEKEGEGERETEEEKEKKNRKTEPNKQNNRTILSTEQVRGLILWQSHLVFLLVYGVLIR